MVTATLLAPHSDDPVPLIPPPPYGAGKVSLAINQITLIVKQGPVNACRMRSVAESSGTSVPLARPCRPSMPPVPPLHSL